MAQDDPQEEGNPNQTLMDALLLLRFRIERVIQRAAPRLVEIMKRADRQINEWVARPTDLTQTNRVQLSALIEATVSSAVDEIEREMRRAMVEVAKVSAEGTSTAIERTMERETDDTINPVDILSEAVLGATLSETLAAWQQQHIEKYETALTEGAREDLSGEDVARELRQEPGDIKTSQNGLTTEIITLLGGAAVTGQNRVTRQERDAIAYWQRLAVLDARTSNECLSNHGTRYYPPDLPEFPPWHRRCRSQTHPVYRGYPEPNVPPDGETWLRSQSAATQEEMLGPSRYEAWKAGSLKIEPGELTRPDGTDYTLAELRRRGVDI